MIVYHGGFEIIKEPEIRITKFNKDFYFGFYCTIMEEQAKRWATRFGNVGYVNEYEYTEIVGLDICKFDNMTEEWLDFIVACRLGKKHDYDIVEGPMADDQIYNYIQGYIDELLKYTTLLPDGFIIAMIDLGNVIDSNIYSRAIERGIAQMLKNAIPTDVSAHVKGFKIYYRELGLKILSMERYSKFR